MRILLAVVFLFAAQASVASDISIKSCEKYGRDASFSKALDVISTNFKHNSRDELCALPHLFDVYMTNTMIFNLERQKDEPHVWVTLHYAEHSCQYFVKNEDWTVTKKNCYNTTF